MREVPNWSEYFMTIAETVSIRSKDPNTQVGSVVVDKDNHIIGTGYNGFSPGINELPEMWERPTKYDYVIHAEANALLNCTCPTAGSKIYVTLFPCKECAKLIAGARIKKVYYKYSTINGKDYYDLTSLRILLKANIDITQVK